MPAANQRKLAVSNIPSTLIPPLPYAHRDDSGASASKVKQPKGVHVSSNANAASCAELAIFLALSLAKKAKDASISVQSGRLGFPVGDTLLGSRILIVGKPVHSVPVTKTSIIVMMSFLSAFSIGFGNIARELVPRLKPFRPSRLVAVRKSPWPSIDSVKGCQSNMRSSSN